MTSRSNSGTDRVPVLRAARRRAREEITHEILEAARRRLATEGAAALSLRAVARDVGMVSSAVYRYVAGRDELLTLLILDGYNALGEAVEAGERAVARAEHLARWLAICHGVRDWALAHPHEYALIYGSPVPGYVAPEATVPAATRVTALLGALLEDVVAADPGVVARLVAERCAPMDPEVSASMRPTRPFVPEEVPDELLIRGLAAWTYLFGAVSFELFGHRHHVIDDDPALRRAFFTEEMLRSARTVGIARALS
jgi:AcrR family transcriptional regulator